MSVVGELPIDVTGFSSPEFNFDQHKPTCGHSRQPSHRRTASLVMYFDDDFIGPNPAIHRPGTPPACTTRNAVFGSSMRNGAMLGSAWGHVEDLKINTKVQNTEPVVPKIAAGNIESTMNARKPDVQELFGSIWGGADATRKAHNVPLSGRSSRSSHGTPSSIRSVSSPFAGLMGILKSRYSLDRSPMASDLGQSSLKDNGKIQATGSNYKDDDCESSGTVVEHDDECEDTPVSQADDANMRNDLYTEDKASMGDDSHSNDSIDEDEFPIDTIVESALESQKTRDLSGLDCVAEDATVDCDQEAELGTPDEDTESVDIIHGSPTSFIVHSHTVSEGSQQELDMPLPEIVTGSILQGLHDEISQKLVDEVADDPCNDTVGTKPVVEKSPAVDDRYQSNWVTKGTEEQLYLGLRWVRVVPDKDLVQKVHRGVIRAGEFVLEHWKWVPVVALPLVLVALTR